MKLTRHRGHGGGWEAVDVERPHLVDLRGGESHAGREVTSVACCHDGCLLLHELKKRDTERWVEDGEGWMGECEGAGRRTGCERGEGRTDGNEKYSKLGRSQTKTGEGEARERENIARVKQREGCMLRLMDG